MEELYQQLQKFQPYNLQEEEDKKGMLLYMESFSNVFTRDNIFGHFTSSPWIVNTKRDKVLMVYHSIYQSWSWCGGHCDGNQNVLEVALKEGKEETGLQNLKAVSNDIFAIDLLSVIPHMKKGAFVSAHTHLNITFLCEADEAEVICCKPDENKAVKWIPIEDINTYVQESAMRIVYQKLIEKVKKLGV
ncbi:MAG: NUDIX hydrolase [Erysipelotrichaceae bacterium]|nr:NUDIX hydrolase [Erysipelotrichaceae bacterium]